ncbi:hypothetical protein GlitD10_2672 [Gloeomargarita lithophora Alchichica-D10]|uniref:Uncharacterized protein n=1 Tax=Gloeomargarita lithophora Alchichica-D10 TaxID=1188229 RepID=A0A1J0AGH4_9CYAN|nr:hypothetical protein [Gloeomargarita lithophora]APB35015.1 hypothetical protein GlitD10_2672 [Gloeomargarita lithophora Alchichica-D10]
MDLALLEAERSQLHYGIQFPAAVAVALAAPQADYRHTALRWSAATQSIISTDIPADTPFTLALEPLELTLNLRDGAGTVLTSLFLVGQTLATGLAWLQTAVTDLGADGSKISWIAYPPDDFPDHPLAHGAAFATGQPEFRQLLIDHYALTHQQLTTLAQTYPQAPSPVIWPHHFDLATLIPLGAGTGEANPAIGVGLSPGDGSYGEPYWYVSPWPYPQGELPAISAPATWHTQGWVGAVLRRSHLARDNHSAMVEAFIQEAVAVCRGLV